MCVPLRGVIEEHQPDGNRIHVDLECLDEYIGTVEWKALTSPGLRIGLGRMLAPHARAVRGQRLNVRA